MKKRPLAIFEGYSSNSNAIGLEARELGRILHMKHPPQTKKSLNDDPHFAQAVQNYEAGLRALQERKYDKAKALFQKVIASGSRELGDRANVHLNTCNQHLERAATSFKTTEEHFDYAISLMNVGDYIGAREHLEKLAKQAPKADYVQYGLAALSALTNRPEEALRYLSEEIQLNANLRFQARNDSDFQNLFEDPRFTELLYPETSSDVPPYPKEPEGEE
jgi:tetratricopeptide (TPR) repeat protein